ncbi:hypothetical protein ACFQUU_15660 [Herbaspirillum sp. GCM10030257]|uniref:hypothetical protein n=1 Tax=Herbaspirillum sp. GCM10030257 TaxID=3273393 RepID=UPI00361DA0A5
MRASGLVSELANLIAIHGDLLIMYDCDSVLRDPVSIIVLDEPYLSEPVFVIYLVDANSENTAA